MDNITSLMQSMVILFAVFSTRGAQARSFQCVPDRARPEAIRMWENPCEGLQLADGLPRFDTDLESYLSEAWNNIESLVSELERQLEDARDAQRIDEFHADEHGHLLDNDALLTLPYTPIATMNSNAKSWPILAYHGISNVMLHLHLFDKRFSNELKHRIYRSTFDHGNQILCHMNLTMNPVDVREHNLHSNLEDLRHIEMNMCISPDRKYAREYVMLRDSLKIVQDCRRNIRSYQVDLASGW